MTTRHKIVKGITKQTIKKTKATKKSSTNNDKNAPATAVFYL